MPHSGNDTSGSNFNLSISQNEGGFHQIVFGKRTISKGYVFGKKIYIIGKYIPLNLQKDDNYGAIIGK